MNALRTHTNNLTSLLRRAAIDNTNPETTLGGLVTLVTDQYINSPEFAAVGTAVEAKLAAKAVKAPKVYPLDENGNPIKPKRGRPVGSKNKPKVPAPFVEIPIPAATLEVVSTPAVYEGVSAEA